MHLTPPPSTFSPCLQPSRALPLGAHHHVVLLSNWCVFRCHQGYSLKPYDPKMPKSKEAGCVYLLGRMSAEPLSVLTSSTNACPTIRQMDARCGQTGKSLNDACTLVGLHACMHVRSRKHSACMHACVCMDDMNVCMYVRT